MKKTALMSIRMDSALRSKVESLAKVERRSLADQAAYLIEKGLKALETTKSAKKKPAA